MNDQQYRDLVGKFVDGTPLEDEYLRAALNANLIFVNGGQWALTEFGRTFLPAGPDDDIEGQCEPTCYWPGHTNWTHTEHQKAQETIKFIGPPFNSERRLAQPSAKDTQIGGDHYKKMGAYQPWEVLAHWLNPDELRGYMKGTVIAYLAREREKGGDTDIAKAMHTMQLWQEVRKDK